MEAKFEIESACNFIIFLLEISAQFSESELLDLHAALTKGLKGRFAGHWFPDRLIKDSVYRSLRFRHTLDWSVRKACEEINLCEKKVFNHLPRYLIIWISPGLVTCQCEKVQGLLYRHMDEETGHKNTAWQSKLRA